MEAALARYRAAIHPWARLKLARALLQQAVNRFRERAQAPMVAAASQYSALMTNNRYPRLVADETKENPVLLALREDGKQIGVEAMSEGTATPEVLIWTGVDHHYDESGRHLVV